MIKKVIYKIVSIYRKYWDFPMNWSSDFDYEKTPQTFIRAVKL